MTRRTHHRSRALTKRGVTAVFTMLAGAFAMAATPAAAQDAAVDGSAQLQASTRISKLGDLDFGMIIPGNSGGTVAIDPDGTLSTGGSVIAVGGATQPASFNITRRVLLDYPTYEGPDGTDTILLTNASQPSETMLLRDFTTDFNRTIFFGLPAYFFQASFDFNIGGTIDVAPDQAGGVYSGTFTVTVEYD